MKGFFLSLKTAVWTLFVLVCLFFIGSYMMPVHRGIFAPMNEDILFKWVGNVAVRNALQTWWFFAAVAGLVLLTLNTLVCSAEAIRGKWSRSDFLVRISPQVVHIGFLLILLAHLLSSGWGYKISGIVPEGAFAQLPEGRGLFLKEIRVQSDAAGYMKDWAAAVSVYERNNMMKNKSAVLGPNQPLFYEGTAIYLKSLNFDRGPAAFLLIVDDPGAIWALAGGILFMIGSVTLLILKWNARSRDKSA